MEETSIHTKIHALIIDDEFDIFYLLKEILKGRDIQTTHVGTLAEARHALQTVTPSLILLDNHLPDGTGIDFIKYIRDTCPETKVIVFTGDDTLSNINKARKEGAVEFIGKPFSIQKVYATIDKIIKVDAVPK